MSKKKQAFMDSNIMKDALKESFKKYERFRKSSL